MIQTKVTSNHPRFHNLPLPLIHIWSTSTATKRQGGTLKLHVVVRPGDAEDARPASVAYARGIYLGSESLHTMRDSLKDGHDFGVAKVQVDRR